MFIKPRYVGIVLSMSRGAWKSDGDLTRTLLAVATYLYQSNISSVQFPYIKSLVKPWLNQPGFYSTPPPQRPPSKALHLAGVETDGKPYQGTFAAIM